MGRDFGASVSGSCSSLSLDTCSVAPVFWWRRPGNGSGGGDWLLGVVVCFGVRGALVGETEISRSVEGEEKKKNDAR